MNIGGRYLQRVNSREGNDAPARSSWRESVYGVQYKEKQPTTPTSPVPPPTPKLERKNSEVERRRLERERQIQMDKMRQQSLEEEREERRLRQALRKATWDKDEAKIREVDAEIKRFQKARDDRMAREREIAEKRPLPRQSSFKATAGRQDEPDIIEKVSSWQEKNQKRSPTEPQKSPAVLDETQIAMSFTDFDDYLRARLAAGGKECPWSTYYPENDVDDLGGEISLVYKTKKAKDLFSQMPTELQNLVVRAHKRPVRFAAIMDLCKTDKFGQEFSTDSERHFKGYSDVNTMITDFGFDMTKVSEYLLHIFFALSSYKVEEQET